MVEPIRVVLQRTKETKNMTRFDVAAGDEELSAVKTLYVRQAAVAELGAPGSLVVTIAAAEDAT